MSFIHVGTFVTAKFARYSLKVNSLSLLSGKSLFRCFAPRYDLNRKRLTADKKPAPATEKQRRDGFQFCVVC